MQTAHLSEKRSEERLLMKSKNEKVLNSEHEVIRSYFKCSADIKVMVFTFNTG